MIERVWIIVAGLLVIRAAIFLWRNNLSAAFVTATLGVVAWFLSYRVQLRAKLAANERDESLVEDSDEN